MSAAESRLVLSRSRTPRVGSVDSVIAAMLRTEVMSGPPWSTRPRSRSSALSRRRSLAEAYVDGRVRERAISPSSLSNISCWPDMPTKPASRASASRRCIATISDSVALTSLRVARSRPISAARRSEWPTKAPRLGPSGSDSSAATYSSAVRQPPPGSPACVSSSAAMTWARGMASTRPNRSPAVVGSTCSVDSEQEPSSTVVTPWRSDSASAGPCSTSMS